MLLSLQRLLIGIVVLATGCVADEWYNPNGTTTLGDTSLNPVWLNGSHQTLAFLATQIPVWGLWMYQVDHDGSVQIASSNTPETNVTLDWMVNTYDEVFDTSKPLVFFFHVWDGSKNSLASGNFNITTDPKQVKEKAGYPGNTPSSSSHNTKVALGVGLGVGLGIGVPLLVLLATLVHLLYKRPRVHGGLVEPGTINSPSQQMTATDRRRDPSDEVVAGLVQHEKVGDSSGAPTPAELGQGRARSIAEAPGSHGGNRNSETPHSPIATTPLHLEPTQHHLSDITTVHASPKT